MAHYPVNHHLRPVYRAVAGLIGLYFLAFGILGTAASWGDPLFDRGAVWVLGLRTNLAWSLLAAVLGVVVLAAVVIGGNLYQRVTTVAGWGLLVLAVFHLAVLQTEVNILNFSMVDVLACMVAGLLLITAGLYGRVQPAGAPEHTEPGVGNEPVAKSAPRQAAPRPVRDTADR